MPIIRDLVDAGWEILTARQNGHDDIYASHRITFGVPGLEDLYEKIGEVLPTCTLYNSHNRTRRVTFVIGLLRKVCSNGLLMDVLSHGLDKIHILGWQGVNIDSMISAALTQFGSMATTVKQMMARRLTPTQQLHLAKQALSIKQYGDPQWVDLYTTIEADRLLNIRRPEDSGDTLWITFNRIQENITNGPRGGIQEVSLNRKVNLGLWSSATALL
jgi:hypothetical protein